MAVGAEPLHQYVLFLYNRWQQRGKPEKMVSSVKMSMKQRCVLNSSLRRKWHLLTFIHNPLTIYGCRTIIVSTVMDDSGAETVGHLTWYRFLQAQLAGSFSPVVEMHS